VHGAAVAAPVVAVLVAETKSLALHCFLVQRMRTLKI